MTTAAPQPDRVTEAVAVVIPMANEEATAEPFLREVLAQLGARDFVHVVLDGVCRDGTRSIVDALAAEDPRLRLVWAPENRCVVDAYFAGYRAALATGAEWILEMDAGYSHQPREIGRFLAAATEGYDYVGGSRFMPGGEHAGPWKRTLISWLGSTLARLVLRRSMTDFTSGFQLYRRPLMEDVVRRGVMSRAHFFQTEIRFHATAWKWTEVPIHYGRTGSEVPDGSVREALVNLWKLSRGDGV
jgi:dolichol-phosphate mannosyltransferase